MKDIRDYIVIVKDVLSTEVCDAALAEYAGASDWIDTMVRGGLMKDVRSAHTILMSTEPCIAKNPHVRKLLDDKVFEGASKAIGKYNERFNLAHIEEDSGYEILRYQVGQFYTQHTDAFKKHPRTVSCSFALNDDYSGGEFAFFDREIKIKAPKGSAVMFPSNFMYPHEILPVISGTRYSIITWFV
jgi:predicted 2-oxoglutarate/Fe(II)-dependent dioxygenase YbiX